ncbi:hypothetical protein PRK78_001811 [Emydomyces testavorans]|uniref:Chromo domain-containing protein n=1 Tax=Emydomyces testavorans TaxID=2070801 RepID=A0AAF0IH15_9EURO|nr:hypothetical protein PRK78_001811 [Emydomyces testavorans]
MQTADSFSDDDVSITSTVPSEPQDEYELECILAQRTLSGKDMYLVKWSGYPMERCTWETEDMFCNPETLRDWATKRDAIARGEEPAFDVEALERKWLAAKAATDQRRKKRRKKREQLGYPVDPQPEKRNGFSDLSDFVVPDHEVEYEQSDCDDEPLMKRRFKANSSIINNKDTAVRAASNPGQVSAQSSVDKPSDIQSNHGHTPAQPRLKLKTSFPSTKTPSTAEQTLSLFGGHKARKSVLSKISSKQNGELFGKLSTQRRWEKALRRERTPNIAQLDLRRPQDWLHPQKRPSPSRLSPARDLQNSHNFDSLFVEQEDNFPSHIHAGISPQAPPDRPRNPQPRKPSWDLSSLEKNSPLNTSYSPNSASDTNPRATTRSGRFWNPGEVLVFLTFGAVGKVIGDVRICGLNKTTKNQLLRMKTGKIIDLNFNDVCTIDEYRILCEHRYNQKYANSHVFGFEDTSQEVTAMADYLRRNDLAALWYHPAEIGTVFVAYASSSTHWNFLDGGLEFPPNASLRIVARNYLPPISTVRQKVPYTMEATAPTSVYTNVTAQEPEEPIAVNDPVSPAPLLSNLANLDIVTVFRERWNITFEELSRVNSSKKNTMARVFYLFFPTEAEDEFQLLVMFLKNYTHAIFSNRLEGDWERFIDTATTGTVIFHQSYIWYEFMPGLQKLLRNPVNVFNISLAAPVKHLEYETHLQRLFPHGFVVLMTEDYMIHEPEAALNVMKWFRKHIVQKFPGTWKMFFRPNILGWLSEIFSQWPDDKSVSLLPDSLNEIPNSLD